MVITFTVPVSVHACSCIPPAPPEASFEKADAVFSGEVVNVMKPILGERMLRVRFAVEDIWKGDVDARMVISTAVNSAACGFSFAEGERYLVYAYKNEDGFATSLCSRTSSFPSANADIAQLGTPESRISVQDATTNDADAWQLGMLVIVAGGYVGGVAFYHGRRC